MESWKSPLWSLKSTINLHRPQSINILICPRISKTQGVFFFFFFSPVLEWQLLLKPLDNAKC